MSSNGSGERYQRHCGMRRMLPADKGASLLHILNGPIVSAELMPTHACYLPPVIINYQACMFAWVYETVDAQLGCKLGKLTLGTFKYIACNGIRINMRDVRLLYCSQWVVCRSAG